jgi:hypothetical protein
MDAASVEAAFSVRWAGGTTPRNGYVFHWSADLRQVTVVPDTQDPAGETNVDLLPEATELVMALTTGAKDLAGNALDAPLSVAFTTRDETAPSLVSVLEKRSGLPSPFDPSFLQTVTLLATFDEDMSPAQASARLETSGRWLEGGMRSIGVQSASAGGGGIVYTLSSCASVDLRAGDLVSVWETNPPGWEALRATVTAFDPGPCTVAVAARRTRAAAGWRSPRRAPTGCACSGPARGRWRSPCRPASRWRRGRTPGSSCGT